MIQSGLAVVLILLASLASGMWVMMSLLLTGTLGLALFRDMPLARLMAQNLWNTTTSESLLVLPLFIFMAEILFRSRLSQNLFTGLAPWTARLPGRLLHVNVLGCTLFAATCGSSAATTATIGRITYGELTGRGYDRRIVIGSLAGAGTLGLLIPPSTIMIVYGVLSDTSILALFLSGFVPGLVLAGAFMVFIAVRTGVEPGLLPDIIDQYTMRDRLRGLRQISPVVLLVATVIGSLYSGVVSPIETAVFGVVGALVIALLQRALGWRTLMDALIAAANTTSMLGLITAAAVFLSVALGFLGIPRQIAQTIVGLGLDPLVLIALLVVVYLLLGCFLDGISMIVMTVPIVLPIVTAAGYHPVWFGVFLVIVVEMAQITPPIGFNLFVIQGLTGERLVRIALDTLPFFVILAGFAILIAFVPDLAMLGVRGSRAG